MAVPRLEKLERAIGYRFKNPVLAERALTHRSTVTGRAPAGARGNEQLEYLGDAVIGFLVAEYLVTVFPHWNEGQLSKSRARLVSTTALAVAARRLGLGEHLHLGRGEEKTGGREKPALLANAFEALVAAIYLDAGLEPTRHCVSRMLLEVAVKAEGSRLGLADHKSALQEFLQSRAMPAASYQIVREAGPDHRKTFWVEVRATGQIAATGIGATMKEAEQSAAEQVLARLRVAKS